MSIRLIAIDIDGTLMPSSGPQISQKNLTALRDAEAAGVEIVIATGRRHAYAMPLIAPLGLKQDSTMISSNGAVIRLLDGTLLDRQFLPAETARRLCGSLRPYGTLLFTFDREGMGALVIESLVPLHARIERWVEANRPYLLEVQPIESAFDGEVLPIQGMVCGGVESMRLAEEGLRSAGLDVEVSMHRTEYPKRDLSMLDLLPLGSSKGVAIHKLAQARGLKPDEIMAIGDNLNDVEMLKYAGRAVLMANASDEMHALAEAHGWERTAGNDEDGVALAVESALMSHKSFAGIGKASSQGGALTASAAPPAHPKGSMGDIPAEDTITEWAQ